MASNGVMHNETATYQAREDTDDSGIRVKVEEKEDSCKSEIDGTMITKTEVKVRKEEHGCSKMKMSVDDVKMEENTQKQETPEADVAIVDISDVQQTVRGVKRDVKKDRDSKQQGQENDRSHIRRMSVNCDAALWDSIEWDVAAGGEVDAGQMLGTVGRLEEGTQRPMYAPCKGRLYILTKEQSGELLSDTKEAGGTGTRIVAFVEYCVHPVRNGRTCLMCLSVVDDNEENGDIKSVNVVSHGQVFRLNVEEARKFDSDTIRRQLGAKKLSLVLDLDHTLLHAVRVDDVVGDITQSDNIYYFLIPGLAQQHVVKLRPGLAKFLTNLSAFYDLFIYTHGTRLYAEQIVKIIDPDEMFFKNRIVARTDTPDMLHKSLKLLFPSCDDSMILILDDRIDVWKENEENVFLIEPYHYFKCTTEINNASGRGMTGTEDSEAENGEDRHLAQANLILEQVHKEFYAGHEHGMQGTTAEEQMTGNGRNVKAILSAQKRTILHGCKIIFSGVFPIVGPQSYESHYLWRLAVNLGALPSTKLTDFPLTHLVIHPERLGTQKYVQAKKIPGAFIVTPDWIVKCARSWYRVPEQDFLADEWKVKHTKKEPEKLADRTGATPEAGGAFESLALSGVNGDIDGKSPQFSACPAVGAQEKTVTNNSSKRKEEDAKRSKQVSFAEVLDDSGTSFGKDGTVQKPKVVRSRVIRRPIKNFGVATGVVATGGTFDFLSKINATKREAPRASVKSKKVEEAKKTQNCCARPPKDMDDAFLRLMEAEEREHENEKKRKHSSTNIKDQLVSRRTKLGKRSLETRATVLKSDERRIRDVASALADEKLENDDEEEEELDDLEADILGDL